MTTREQFEHAYSVLRSGTNYSSLEQIDRQIVEAATTCLAERKANFAEAPVVAHSERSHLLYCEREFGDNIMPEYKAKLSKIYQS